MSMVEISATTTAGAPKSLVWEILADFPNIADWTSQVKRSESTSTEPAGVGASRHCDLSPAGSTDETIREWVPEDRMVVSVDSVSVLPIKGSRTTFSLNAVGDGATEITMSVQAEPKGGILSGLIAKRLERGLPKAAAGLIGDLGAEAERRAASA